MRLPLALALTAAAFSLHLERAPDDSCVAIPGGVRCFHAAPCTLSATEAGYHSIGCFEPAALHDVWVDSTWLAAVPADLRVRQWPK